MNFINEDNLINVSYEKYPFPHTIIDNFLKNDVLDNILLNINNLNDEDADSKFIDPSSPNEYNKYAFSSNYGDYLKKIFIELNSTEFIKYLEKVTGIENIITNDIALRGAGIHRIKNGGYLQLHTDFNSYYNHYGKLDRRINLLIYMNPEWKEEYKGELCICDKETNICVKKILPILNRCVIFNTSNKSIHGHPEKLNTPENIRRQSIAVYYYTKNTNNQYDFEGDTEHSTIWYPNIII
jgi:Rps23 Pro-64 3,4-dihydroxylase Tpa1-like proline 4-hydroxylase